jgi:hypothetical protein
MHERDLSRAGGIRARDVDEAVRTAMTAIWQADRGTWKLIGGTDLDGDPLTVVVAIDDDRSVTLVTVHG